MLCSRWGPRWTPARPWRFGGEGPLGGKRGGSAASRVALASGSLYGVSDLGMDHQSLLAFCIWGHTRIP